MDGSAIVFGIVRELQTHDAQGEYRCDLCPGLVAFDETREDLRELCGILLGCDDVAPRLFVVGRGCPASRFEQRKEIGLGKGPSAKA